MNGWHGYGRLSSLHKPSSYTRIHIDSSSITLHCSSITPVSVGSSVEWEKAATKMSLLWKAITAHVSSFACCSQTPLFYLFSFVCVCTYFHVGTWIRSSAVNIQCLFHSLHIFWDCSPTEIGVHSLARLAGQQAPGTWVCATSPDFLHGCGGEKLNSSCLQSKHLPNSIPIFLLVVW